MKKKNLLLLSLMFFSFGTGLADNDNGGFFENLGKGLEDLGEGTVQTVKGAGEVVVSPVTGAVDAADKKKKKRLKKKKQTRSKKDRTAKMRAISNSDDANS